MIAEKAHVVKDETYPIELVDKLLLTNYEDHVTRQLGNGLVSNKVDICSEINVLFIGFQF